MRYYPSNNLILSNTIITRTRTLPPGVRGEVLVNVGSRVSPDTVVVGGTKPSDYVIIDVAGALNIDPDDEEKWRELIKIKPGQLVEANQPLTDAKKRRRNTPVAPERAIVSLIEDGRVILQVRPETIEVKAKMQGEVIEVDPGYGVTIQGQGVLMQCAWGNGQFNMVNFAFEPGFEYGNPGSPQGGLQKLLGQDTTLSRMRGRAFVLLRPLTELDLEVVEEQELGGIVAPSAPVDLREKAMQLKVPVILTEGFGKLQPTTRLYDLLAEKRSNAAILDAAAPDFHTMVRPEIIIPASGGSRDRSEAVTNAPLSVGMRVRVRRAPYAGRIGEIAALPDLPVSLENGLRVICAQVTFPSGERGTVPLANLESLGEASVE